MSPKIKRRSFRLNLSSSKYFTVQYISHSSSITYYGNCAQATIKSSTVSCFMLCGVCTAMLFSPSFDREIGFLQAASRQCMQFGLRAEIDRLCLDPVPQLPWSEAKNALNRK
jgi:hypothetical protein